MSRADYRDSIFPVELLAAGCRRDWRNESLCFVMPYSSWCAIGLPANFANEYPVFHNNPLEIKTLRNVI
jgi:hypothetical protein